MATFHIPEPLPPEGFSVPADRIESRYLLLGFLPGHSHNDISCRLVLHPAKMEIKVMATSYHEYTALRQVDYLPAWFLRGERLGLKFGPPEAATYYVKPSSEAVSREFIRFCHERGLPLSAAAQQLLSKSEG